MKFVSDLRQVGGFTRVLWFPPPIYSFSLWGHHDRMAVGFIATYAINASLNL